MNWSRIDLLELVAGSPVPQSKEAQKTVEAWWYTSSSWRMRNIRIVCLVGLRDCRDGKPAMGDDWDVIVLAAAAPAVGVYSSATRDIALDEVVFLCIPGSLCVLFGGLRCLVRVVVELVDGEGRGRERKVS